MLETVVKILVTSVTVVAVAEAAKRNVLLASILASLPMTSLLAFAWLWADTKDPEKVAALAEGIFWLVLPSLVLFLALPFLLRRGVPFWPSLLVAGALTVAGYAAMLRLLERFGIAL